MGYTCSMTPLPGDAEDGAGTLLGSPLQAVAGGRPFPMRLKQTQVCSGDGAGLGGPGTPSATERPGPWHRRSCPHPRLPGLPLPLAANTLAKEEVT